MPEPVGKFTLLDTSDLNIEATTIVGVREKFTSRVAWLSPLHSTVTPRMSLERK